MGIKKMSGMKLPSGPVSAIGLMFMTGFLVMAISFDQMDDRTTREAFYYRKAVEPANFMKGLTITMAFFGLINYIRTFISAFRFNISSTRKMSDILGTFLFFGNIFFNVLVVMPMEKKVGNEGKLLNDVDSEKLRTDLYNSHLQALAISLSLLVQQFISFKEYEKAKSIEDLKQKKNK